MKQKILLITTFLLCIPAYGSLLKNGDFEKGSSGWKGDKKVVYETEAEKNKVCKIDVDDKDFNFYQEVKVKNKKDITILYKVKGVSNYQGRGISIRLIRDDGSYTFYDRKIKGKDWKEQAIKFSDLKKTKKLKVMFIVRSGKQGSVMFDDVRMTAK